MLARRVLTTLVPRRSAAHVSVSVSANRLFSSEVALSDAPAQNSQTVEDVVQPYVHKKVANTRPNDSQYKYEMNSYKLQLHGLRKKWKAEYDMLKTKKAKAIRTELLTIRERKMKRAIVKAVANAQKAQDLEIERKKRLAIKAKKQLVKAEVRKEHEAFREAEKKYQIQYLLHERQQYANFYENPEDITPSLFEQEADTPTGWWPPKEEVLEATEDPLDDFLLPDLLSTDEEAGSASLA